MATANHVLLRRITLSASAASVTFDLTGVSGYTDLKIVVSARCDTASVQQVVTMKINSLTSGYADKYLYGSGSAAGSGSFGTTSAFIGDTASANATANTFGSQEIYIPNYTSSTAKSWSVDSVAETNAATAYMELTAGYNSTTSAISNIVLAPSNGNFVTGSSFSLYGIANAVTTPVSAPKADGGDIIKTDGTYWYHAFLSTGSFKPQVNLTADILQVAGGGGGGGNGGGGGAGGLLGFTSQALSSTSTYTCTVGAGGAAGTSSTQGFQGSNSQFGSLTASIGGGDGNTQSSPWTYGTGGSGGGGGSGSSTGRAGTSGQGNSGGNSVISSPFPNGGGGGAGSAGGNGSGSTGGAGGAGATYNTTVGGSAGPYAFINAMGAATGTGQLVSGNYYYAGGGGGCVNSGTGGAGGNGGGATGTGSLSGGAAPSGTPNTGGGGAGGGGSSDSYRGGAGGSGIIIIRYPV